MIQTAFSPGLKALAFLFVLTTDFPVFSQDECDGY